MYLCHLATMKVIRVLFFASKIVLRHLLDSRACDPLVVELEPFGLRGGTNERVVVPAMYVTTVNQHAV
jgi:hypothetical protein